MSRPGRPQPTGAATKTYRLLSGDFLVSDVMRSLRAGVPISLLADLASADGPDSAGILLAEADDVDDTWIQRIAS